MVRAQVVREELRQSVSREEFLASLNIRMLLYPVVDVNHRRFPRVLELINKTNQFNTTGKRWTQEECGTAFAGGTVFYVFELSDRYTDYGLVGVTIVDRSGIPQFVMSCRVLGLEAERAALSKVLQILEQNGKADIFCAMVATDRNLPCRKLYQPY
jgi:FkbH-like protein